MMTTETIETTETATAKLPFPSHVKTPAINADAIAISSEVIATSRDLANVMATAGNVHNFVRPHYVNMETGTYGIERLISDILRANVIESHINATGTFPKGIEQTEFRSIAIAGGMFASEVIAKVREIYGADRYPDLVIHTYLGHHMMKPNSKNQTGKIQLSNAEDKNRPCKRPRLKYYLLDPQPEKADAVAETMPTVA